MAYGGTLCAHAHKFLLSPRAFNLCRQNTTRLQQFQTLTPLHSHSLPFNFNNSATPFKPTLPLLSALSNDGSGLNGTRGGGGGGSDGPNSGGGGDGGDKWSFLSWYLALLGQHPVSVKTPTSAILNLIGDLLCQLVIDKVPSLDFKRTFVFTFLGFALVGPTLHCWLTVVFPAFDEFFIIFCIGMACIVFFALFCIIPIIALAYAMRIREGASEVDIRSLPMYRFSQSNSLVMVDDNKKQLVKGRVDSCGSHMSELSLHPDDSECCICLCPYVEGAELYRLPCTHHFHCGCIGRWLQIKATCPLCKFNILRDEKLRRTLNMLKTLEFQKFHGVMLSASWYLYLSKLVTLPGASGALLRLVLDQFLFSPIFIRVFLSTLVTLEGSPSQAVPMLKQEWFSAVLANWKLWIPFQFLNVRFVPQQFQVLAANGIALVGNVILSFMAHKEVLTKLSSDKELGKRLHELYSNLLNVL